MFGESEMRARRGRGYPILILLAISGMIWSGCSLGPSEGPLHVAASTCNVEMTQEKLENGTDPDGLYGETHSALFVAAGGGGSGGSGCLETLRLMINAGGDPTRLENGDSIFLLVALHQSEVEVVDFLLEEGADPCMPLSIETQRRYFVSTIAELATKSNTKSMAGALSEANSSCIE